MIVFAALNVFIKDRISFMYTLICNVSSYITVNALKVGPGIRSRLGVTVGIHVISEQRQPNTFSTCLLAQPLVYRFFPGTAVSLLMMHGLYANYKRTCTWVLLLLLVLGYLRTCTKIH